MMTQQADWRNHSVRIVRNDQVAPTPPRWSGVHLDAVTTSVSAHARKFWLGSGQIQPNTKTAPHHHGELENLIYVVSGKVGMRWGERLEYYAEARPDDFIFVPPVRAALRTQRQSR